jgi:hypothetical protein
MGRACLTRIDRGRFINMDGGGIEFDLARIYGMVVVVKMNIFQL